MRAPVVVKKSPIVIVRNFVALQFASLGLYLFAGSLAYYARIWRGHAIGHIIPFQVAQALFIFTIELVLVLYIFLSWYRQTVRVTGDRLVYDQGVLWRHHTVISLSRIASAAFTQSALGKLTHYGSVCVRDGAGAVLLRLSGLPEPQQFVDHLVAVRPLSGDAEPAELVSADENERLERKSTFRWDVRTRTVNRALEKAAMKTVAAFLNSDGGHLVLGVGDDGAVVGVAHDYATLARKDADGLVNHFGNVFNAMLGAHVRHLVQLKPFMYGDTECMMVSVSVSSRPVYLADDGREEFFVRTGNGTTSLKLSEAAAYSASHWGTK